MGVPNTTFKISFTGDGTSTAFPVSSFYFLRAADLQVYVDGVLKTLNNDYTVSGGGIDAGGTVTFNTAPAAASAILIVRNPATTQTTKLKAEGRFPVNSVQAALDQLAMELIYLSQGVARLPDSYTGSASAALPVPVAGAIIGWDATGAYLTTYTGLASVVVSTAMTPVVQASTLALARAAMGVAASVVTTKGDIYVGGASGTEARMPVGANGQALKSDSSQATGVGWFAADSWVAAGGTADAITATFAPAFTSIPDGTLLFVRASAANVTTTPTLNPNATGALTITKMGGGALVPGDIVGAGHELILRKNSAGNRYELLNPKFSGMAQITAATGSDVSLSNTSNYFDGPSIAQGTTGTWLAIGQVTVADTAGAATINAKLWDGTTIQASGVAYLATAGASEVIALSGIFTSPAANIRISARDTTSTSGVIKNSVSGNGLDSRISAIRIA